MIKVLLVAPSLVSPGGVERLVSSISRLLEGTHEVMQVSFDSQNERRFFEDSAKWLPLGAATKLPLLLRWITYLIQVNKLSRVKSEFRPDVTISLLWRGDLVNALSFGADKRISLALINIVDNPSNTLLKKYRILAGFVYRRFDAIYSITRSLNTEIENLFDVSPGKIHNFSHFIETPNPISILNDKLMRFVFCGRLVPEKNIVALIYIWKEFVKSTKNVQLVVIGDGPLKLQVQSTASSMALKWGRDVSDPGLDIVFLGSVSRPEDYIANARAFLLPSTNEGLPTVLLLALAMGVPIIAADSNPGGVRDLLAPSLSHLDIGETETGFLLPIPRIDLESTIQCWVSSLSTLYSDAEKCNKFSRNALLLFENHSMEKAKDQWTGIIEYICKD